MGMRYVSIQETVRFSKCRFSGIDYTPPIWNVMEIGLGDINVSSTLRVHVHNVCQRAENVYGWIWVAILLINNTYHNHIVLLCIGLLILPTCPPPLLF